MKTSILDLAVKKKTFFDLIFYATVEGYFPH